MKKTHDKFFFYVFANEIPLIEKKLGLELNWSPISTRDQLNIPKEILDRMFFIEVGQRYFAEIDKNQKNLKLMQKAFGKRITYRKDGVRTPDRNY